VSSQRLTHVATHAAQQDLAYSICPHSSPAHTTEHAAQPGNRVKVVPNSLLIVHVDIAVVPEQLDAFRAATEENAVASRNEPGVVRFDVLSDRADPGHVVLVEIYRDEAAAAAHKDTAHYQRWRDTVAPMMTRPRQATRYVNTSPDDGDW
jgi:(4S)-4-hydroxy-5-phosphonooxypentane-2,3-dione isomerase